MRDKDALTPKFRYTNVPSNFLIGANSLQEKQEDNKTADTLTNISKDHASSLVELTPHPLTLGFTLSNMAQMSASLKKNLWNLRSEWGWTYPHGWSRKLVLYEEGSPREAICWPDFDGDFSRAVPNRIFSSEQLSHPDMRKSIKTRAITNVLPAKTNDKPSELPQTFGPQFHDDARRKANSLQVMCVSRPKIQVLL
jgi:hypothetical protein